MPTSYFMFKGCRSPLTWGPQTIDAVGEEEGTLEALGLGQIQNGGNTGHFVPSVSRTGDPVPELDSQVCWFHLLTAGILFALRGTNL